MKSKLLTKKSILLTLLIVCLLLAMSFVANKTIVKDRLERNAYILEYSPKTSDDGLHVIGFEQDESGEKVGNVISFLGGTDYNFDTSYIPEKIDGTKIAKISDRAYTTSPSIKRVYIPECITEISKDAFSNKSELQFYVEQGSYAEKFCKENGLSFEYYVYQDADIPKEKIVTGKSYKNFIYNTYFYDNNIFCVITKYNNMSDVSVLEIPGEIDGIKVSAIANGAFRGCKNQQTIILPDTIATIGDYAFADCTSLKDVYFTENIKNIGSDVFSNSPEAQIHAPKGSASEKYATDN